MIGLRPAFFMLLLLQPLLSESLVIPQSQQNDSSTLEDTFPSPQFVYHDEVWLVTFLRNVTETFPLLTHMYSIGKSAEGLLTLCEPCRSVFSTYSSFSLLVVLYIRIKTYAQIVYNIFVFVSVY